MTTMPILATKLYIPQLRSKLVLRHRLIEQMNNGLNGKLTLISAPAGFGKTTLVSEWVTTCARPVAWLSLDEGDTAPARFLTEFVAALRTVTASMGERALGMLQMPQMPPTDSILTALLNEIADEMPSCVLVLDDYHAINSQPINQVLTFLLNHLPPQLHLVIATRVDPHLPLARLRARGQLMELRAADLRFTSAEVAEFLNQVSGLGLSMTDVAVLEARTEGWIAGLQMAAISIQGREDTTNLIKAFTGSHRFVLDYLIEEVLNQQPPDINDFLLKTAILDRMNGSLCNALTGRENGQATLEMLEQANLFIIPLDGRRYWYRYHHLFADLLRQRLHQTAEKEISTLHSQASEWYAQHELPAEAIVHALAGRDFERAAGLIELMGPMLEQGSYIGTWLTWVRAIPDGLIRVRPVLSVWYAYALLGSGQMDSADARLTDAERWLESANGIQARLEYPASAMVVVDKDQFRSLPATIAVARAYHAQALGDTPGTVRYAQHVLNLVPEGDSYRRRQATTLLGLTHWLNGALEVSESIFADFISQTWHASNLSDPISAACVAAEIRITLGRLREGISTLERLLQYIVDNRDPSSPDVADLHRALGELYFERGAFDLASQQLLRSRELGEQAELFIWKYRWCIAQARLHEAQGDLDDALTWLLKAEHFFIQSPLPDVRPISAMKARVWVKQGRLTEAQGWAQARVLSANDDLTYLREFEHITLARILLAQYRRNQTKDLVHTTIGLLERLLAEAQAGQRLGNVIEILILQALAYQAQNDVLQALNVLDRALKLAEMKGYVRPFIDEGSPMARLLREALSHEIVPDYTRRLLAAFPTIKPEPDPPSLQALKAAGLEPLSERELEVLHFIAEGLTNPEIANRLFLALNTIKVHTRNIYSKLGVSNRTQAVARARAFGILFSTK